MLRAKRGEIFFGLYPNCDILGVHQLQMKLKKLFQMNLFGGKTAVWGAIATVPLPGYVTGQELLAATRFPSQQPLLFRNGTSNKSENQQTSTCKRCRNWNWLFCICCCCCCCCCCCAENNPNTTFNVNISSPHNTQVLDVTRLQEVIFKN